MEKNELNIILEDIIKDDITYYQEINLKKGIENFKNKYFPSKKDEKEESKLTNVIKTRILNYNLFDKINLKDMASKNKEQKIDAINFVLNHLRIIKDNVEKKLTFDPLILKRISDDPEYKKLTYTEKIKFYKKLFKIKFGNYEFSYNDKSENDKTKKQTFSFFKPFLKLFEEYDNLEKNYYYSEGEGPRRVGHSKIKVMLMTLILSLIAFAGYYKLKPSNDVKATDTKTQEKKSKAPDQKDNSSSIDTDTEPPSSSSNSDQELNAKIIQIIQNTSAGTLFTIELEREKVQLSGLEELKKGKEGDLESLKTAKKHVPKIKDKDGKEIEPETPELDNLIAKSKQDIQSISEKIKELKKKIIEIDDLEQLKEPGKGKELFDSKAVEIKTEILQKIVSNKKLITDTYDDEIKVYDAATRLLNIKQKSKVIVRTGDKQTQDDLEIIQSIPGYEKTDFTINSSALQKIIDSSFSKISKLYNLVRMSNIAPTDALLNPNGIDNSKIVLINTDFYLGYSCFITDENGDVVGLDHNEILPNGFCNITYTEIDTSQLNKALNLFKQGKYGEISAIADKAKVTPVKLIETALMKKYIDDSSSVAKKDQLKDKEGITIKKAEQIKDIFSKYTGKDKETLKSSIMQTLKEGNKMINTHGDTESRINFINNTLTTMSGSPQKVDPDLVVYMIKNNDAKPVTTIFESLQNNREWDNLLSVLQENYF
jgi:hypothetical protein